MVVPRTGEATAGRGRESTIEAARMGGRRLVSPLVLREDLLDLIFVTTGDLLVGPEDEGVLRERPVSLLIPEADHEGVGRVGDGEDHLVQPPVVTADPDAVP